MSVLDSIKKTINKAANNVAEFFKEDKPVASSKKQDNSALKSTGSSSRAAITNDNVGRSTNSAIKNVNANIRNSIINNASQKSEKGVSLQRKLEPTPTRTGYTSLWDKYKDRVGLSEDDNFDSLNARSNRLMNQSKIGGEKTSLNRENIPINLSNIASKNADSTFLNTVKSYNSKNVNTNIGNINQNVLSERTGITNLSNNTSSNKINPSNTVRNSSLNIGNVNPTLGNGETEGLKGMLNDIGSVLLGGAKQVREPKTVKVKPDGKAPSGLSIGDSVVTSGGTYKIMGVLSDGSYSTDAPYYDPNTKFEVAKDKTDVEMLGNSFRYDDPTADRNLVWSNDYVRDSEIEAVKKERNYYNQAEATKRKYEEEAAKNPEFSDLGSKNRGRTERLNTTNQAYADMQTPDDELMRLASNEQKSVYNYLYNKYNASTAEEYFESLRTELESKRKQGRESLYAKTSTITEGLPRSRELYTSVLANGNNASDININTFGKGNFGRQALQLAEEGDRNKVQELYDNVSSDVTNTVADSLYSSIATVGVQPLAFMDNVIQRTKNELGIGQYRPISTNSELNLESSYANKLRENVSQSIENPALRFAYDGVMAMSDMAMSTLAAGALGSKAVTALMSTTSAQATLLDTLERGGTQNQAFVNAFVNGGLEYLSETRAVEGLFSLGKGLTSNKNIETTIKNILKQSGVEAGGEAFANVSQTYADQLIMGKNSTYTATVQSYINQGMTPDEAERKAVVDLYIKETLRSAALGAVVGGVMGGGATGINTYVTGKTIKSDSNIAQDLAQSTLDFPVEKKYKDTANKIISGQKVSIVNAANMKGALQESAQTRADSSKTELYEYIGEELPDRLVEVFAKYRGADTTGFANNKFTQAWLKKSSEMYNAANIYIRAKANGLENTEDAKELRNQLEEYKEKADVLLYSEYLSDQGKGSAIARAKVNEALYGIKASAAGSETITDEPIEDVYEEEEKPQEIIDLEEEINAPIEPEQQSNDDETVTESPVEEPQPEPVNTVEETQPISNDVDTDVLEPVDTTQPAPASAPVQEPAPVQQPAPVETASSENEIDTSNVESTGNNTIPDIENDIITEEAKESATPSNPVNDAETSAQSSKKGSKIEEYTVGKKQGSTVSYHKSAESENPNEVVAKAKLAVSKQDLAGYDVIRVQTQDNTVTFIKTNGFDSETEPLIESEIKVDAEGNVSITSPTNQIIVDKSTYVPADYTGFDVDAQKQREAKWKNSGIRYSSAKLNDADYFTKKFGSILEEEAETEEESIQETEPESENEENESNEEESEESEPEPTNEQRQRAVPIENARNVKEETDDSEAEAETADNVEEESQDELEEGEEDVSEYDRDVPEGNESETVQESGGDGQAGRLDRGDERESDSGTQQDRETDGGGIQRESTVSEGRKDSDSSGSDIGNDTITDERSSSQSSGRIDSDGNFFIDRGVNPLSDKPDIRAQRNIDAIKLFKQIASESRAATNEEKLILASYSGWGGLTQVFADNAKGKMLKIHDELKEILTTDEYNSARSSILDAYFTPYEVIDNIYKVVNHLGVSNNAKILEPSCGSGYFIGCMPEDLRNGAAISAVELDNITGGIVKLVYDDIDVNIQGFQDYANSGFNLIIGNVPFGNTKVYDKNFKNESELKIHDYFISKGLSMLNDGGIMAVLTTKGTFDQVANKGRKQFAEKANLLGAVRLPAGTFTGTDIVTDLLIFQKKGENVNNEYAQSFIKTVKLENGTSKNEYFVNHPEMILGTEEESKDRYGKNAITINSDGRTIADVVEFLPTSVVPEYVQSKSESLIQESEEAAEAAAQENIEENYVDDTLVVRDDVVYISKDNRLIKYEPQKKVRGKDKYEIDTEKIERIREMNKVLLARNELIRFERSTEDEKAVKKEIKKFETVYDEFVKKYGKLNSRSNKSAYSIDSNNYSKISVIEDVKYVMGKPVISKGDILKKRVISKFKPIESVSNVNDALIMSLNMTGGINLDYMSKLYGKSAETIIKELGDRIYQDPTSESYVTADEYLSGNVREKLDAAEAAAEKNFEYYRNVEALKKVIPANLTETDIKANISSPWVGVENVRAFVMRICNSNNIRLYYDEAQSMWYISGFVEPAANLKWGLHGYTPIAIIGNLLNNKPLTVKVKMADGRTVIDDKKTAELKVRADEIIDNFNEWLWEDSTRREELLDKYNRQFNSLVERKVDGSYLQMPGINPALKLRQHQSDAVAKALSQNSTLFVHPVGAGKTFAMIGAAMEMKRLGIANKPLMAVPNNKISDFLSDFYTMYPAANVLAVSDNDFSKANRQRMLAKIEAGDYDCIIMRHSSFDAFPISVEYMEQYKEAELLKYRESIEAARNNGGRSNSDVIRKLEESIRSYEAKLNEVIDKAAENTESMDVFFDKCGIDAIIADEVQEYKNLFFPTKLSRVKGVVSKMTARSTHMHMITQMMHMRNNRVVFATATPVTNSLSEFYTMQRYLQPELLKKMGLDSFDAWAATFGEIVSSKELNSTGTSIKVTDRFAKFKNVPELIRMLRQNFDIVDKDKIKLKLPKANRHHVQCESTRLLNLFNKVVDSGLAYPDDDKGTASLKAYSDAKMGSMDLRLIHGRLRDIGLIPDDTPVSALDFEGSKINRCVENVLKEYKNCEDIKGAQIIFLDKGVPNKNNKNKVYDFDLYNDIKTKLVRGGIDPDTIAFIQDANTDEKKKMVMNKVNSGEIRVLLGSTATAGVGLNVQERLVSVHHLDAPQRPADYEQRNGRIIRQGNINEEVNIYNYSTLNSYDAPMWQMLDRKMTGINSVMNGDMTVREIEDTGDLDDDFKGMSVEAANNPLLFELRDAQTELSRLSAKSRNFVNQKYAMESIIEGYDKKKLLFEQRIIKAEAIKKQIAEKQKEPMKVDNKTYDKAKEASLAAYKKYMKLSFSERYSPQVIGQINGMNITAVSDSFTDHLHGFKITMEDIPWMDEITFSYLSADGKKMSLNKSFLNPESIFAVLENRIAEAKANSYLKAQRQQLEILESEYAEASKHKDDAFAEEEQLGEARIKVYTLEAELAKNTSSEDAVRIEMLEPENFFDVVNKVLTPKEKAQRVAREAAEKAKAQKTQKPEDDMQYARGINARSTNPIRGNISEITSTQNHGKTEEAIESVTRAEKKDATDFGRIINEIAVRFRINVHVRRYNRRGKNVQGFYDPRHQIIHSQENERLGTVVHELGHHLDNKYGFTYHSGIKDMFENIPDMESSLRDRGYDVANLETVYAEVFADFIWHYLTDPDTAYEMGSYAKKENFFDVFEKQLDKKALKDIQHIRNMILAFNSKDEVERAKSTIVTRKEAKKAANASKTFKQKYDDLRIKTLTTFIDSTAPAAELVKKVEKASGEKLSAAENLQLTLEFAGGASSMTNMLLNENFILPDGIIDKNVGSLWSILKRLDKEVSNMDAKNRFSVQWQEDFDLYLKARHGIDWEREGKATMSSDIAGDLAADRHEANILEYEANIADLDEKYGDLFKDASNEIYKWWDTFMRVWAVDTNLIDGELYDRLHRMRPHYVPMFRDMSDRINASSGNTSRAEAIKRSSRQGSERKTLSPLENIMIQANNIVTAHYKNQVAANIAQLYDSDNEDIQAAMGLYVTEIEPPLEVNRVDMRAVKESLIERFYERNRTHLTPQELARIDSLTEDEQIEALERIAGADIIDTLIDDTVLQFFPSRDRLRSNQFATRYDGKTRYFEILDEHLARAIQTLEPQQMNIAWQTLGKATRAFSAVTTSQNPLFAINNGFRDFQHAWIQTESYKWDILNITYLGAYGKALVTAFVNEFTGHDTEMYQMYRAANGYESKYLPKADTLGKTFKTQTRKLNPISVTKMLLRGIVHFNDAVEAAPRYASFQRAYNKNRKEGKSAEEAWRSAWKASREVTVNFHTKGTATRNASKVIPFVGASMSAIYQFKNLVASKEAYTTHQGRARLVRGFVLCSVASMLLSFLHYGEDEDDTPEEKSVKDEYDKFSNYVKQQYWLFHSDVLDTWIRLPKDREYGALFATLAEYVTRACLDPEYRTTEEIANYAKCMLSLLTPAHDIIGSSILQARNNNTWYGGNIVGTADEDLLTHDYYQYVYDGTTSSLAIRLGEVFSKLPDGIQDAMSVLATPKGIDYAIEQNMGGIADVALPLFTPTERTAGLASSLKAKYTSNPDISNQYTSKAYDYYTQLSAAYEMGESDKEAWYKAFKKTLTKTPSTSKEPDYKTVGDYYADIKAYRNDITMPYKERQELIEEAYGHIAEITESLVKSYESGEAPMGTYSEVRVPADLSETGFSSSQEYTAAFNAIASAGDDTDIKYALVQSADLNDVQKEYLTQKLLETSYENVSKTMSSLISSGVTADIYDNVKESTKSYETNKAKILSVLSSSDTSLSADQVSSLANAMSGEANYTDYASLYSKAAGAGVTAELYEQFSAAVKAAGATKKAQIQSVASNMAGTTNSQRYYLWKLYNPRWKG